MIINLMNQMALIGERQAKVFRIGNQVTVKVTHVDVDERMIDFQIVGMPLPKMIGVNDIESKTIRTKHIMNL